MSKSVARSPLESASVSYAVGLLCAVWFLVLYMPTLKEIASICWTDDDYSHGLILPFVALYILWDRRSYFRKNVLERQQAEFSTKSVSVYGALLLALGMLLFLIGSAANTLFIRWISFFPAASGFLYLLLGRHVANFLTPPLLLLYMAKPLPDSLVPKLFNPFQVEAAKISASVLDMLNVPVHLIGNIIEIPGMRLMVEEACSGMRSLMALLTVAIIVNALVNLSNTMKLAMVVLAVLIAVILNVVRVAMTGILAYFYDPDSATGFFHTFSGMVVFLIGLTLLYGIGTALSRCAWARPGGQS